MTFNIARTYAHVIHATSNLSTSWIVSVNLAGDDIERSDKSIILLIYTQLTLNLILSLRDISRLGIHPIVFTTHKGNI